MLRIKIGLNCVVFTYQNAMNMSPTVSKQVKKAKTIQYIIHLT